MSVAVETRPRRRSAAADWDNGRRMYPAIDDGAPEWARALAGRPDVLYAMIADIVKVAKATDGPRRTGRRPAVSGMSFDEVWATLYPRRYTVEPFGVAMNELLRGRSQRRFAAVACIGQNTLSRLIAGKQKLTLPLLEAIAAAAKVPPGYFAEYRAMRIAEIVTEVLTADPSLGITWLKRLSGGER